MRQAEDATLALPERRIIERPRLLKQLEETQARTILLVAPAGYGKTTLARQWAERNGAAWFTATLSSADVAVLARGLAESLAVFAPSVTKHVDETVRAMQNPARELGPLCEVILSHFDPKSECRLVIDDYQVLEASRVAEDLIAALAKPNLLELLIASRTQPRWATAREYIYGEIFELRREALALDEEETAEVLANSPVYSEMGQQLIATANGWPAVIGLVAIAGAPGAPPREAIPHTLYNFLAEETFNSAEHSTQETLLSLALLPSLSNQALGARFGDSAPTLVADAARTGLVDHSDRGIELHPLARAFLFEKLFRAPRAIQRVKDAVAYAIRQEAWDEAFSLTETFKLVGVLDDLLTASFCPLLASGRVETLERFMRYAVAQRQGSGPLVDLIDAEIAFRDGFLDQAQALSAAAAEGLPVDHPLKARGYILGGTVALVRFELRESHRLHSLALTFAKTNRDEREAVWGQCLALIYLEDDASTDASRRLSMIADALPEDRIRAATAQMLVGRFTAGLRDVGASIAVGQILKQVRDPRARTSFGNVCAYVLALQAKYDAADEVISAALADAEVHRLSFAQPHLLWTKAFIELGLRQFSKAASHLRTVEIAAEKDGNAHLELNARTLRARMLLAQRRAVEAVEATAEDWDTRPTLAMYGEYLATRALALAAAGKPGEALLVLPNVRRMTSVAEVRTLIATTEAITAIGTPRAQAAAAQALELAIRLNTWDALVCGVRAVPRLLDAWALNSAHRRYVVAMLRRSHDDSLMRAHGLSTGRNYTRGGILSPREREVIDLIRQGLTNREIAHTLYISEATAKVHVQHVLEKLGARTRAEAVALYADETSIGPRRTVSDTG